MRRGFRSETWRSRATTRGERRRRRDEDEHLTACLSAHEQTHRHAHTSAHSGAADPRLAGRSRVVVADLGRIHGVALEVHEQAFSGPGLRSPGLGARAYADPSVIKT